MRIQDTRPLRARLMQRWWSWRPDKPVGLQNVVGRVLCLVWGHEPGRSVYCDWCGKEE